MPLLKDAVDDLTNGFSSLKRVVILGTLCTALWLTGTIAFYPLTIHDHIMPKQVFKHFETEDWLTCLQECNLDVDCSSYNFKYDSRIAGPRSCELSKCAIGERENEKDNDLLYQHGFVFQQLRPTKNKRLCTSKTEKKDKDPLSFGGLEASTILKSFGNRQCYIDLSIYLNEGMARSRAWRRCYYAGSGGLDSSQFHYNCDFKGPTVTIVRVDNNVFGGYIDKPWRSSKKGCRWLTSTKAFLFSLYSFYYGYKPCKFDINLKEAATAAYDCFTQGPSFGHGYDLLIYENKNKSYARCKSYKAPPTCSYSLDTCKFYTGKSYFIPDELEVFYDTKRNS